MQIYFSFIFKDRHLNLSQQLWQERRNYQDCQAYDQHCNCLGGTPFPFLQKDTPNIGERYVQRHQDAPRECEQYRRGSKESLTQAKTKELAVPQHTGQSTKQDIVYIKGFFAIIAPTFVPGILIETIDGIRNETTQCHHQCSRQCLEYIRTFSKTEFLSKTQSYTETRTHKSGKKGYNNTFRHRRPAGLPAGGGLCPGRPSPPGGGRRGSAPPSGSPAAFPARPPSRWPPRPGPGSAGE